jgi:hypothetical protein
VSQKIGNEVKSKEDQADKKNTEETPEQSPTSETGTSKIEQKKGKRTESVARQNGKRRKDSDKHIVEKSDALGNGISIQLRTDNTQVAKDVVIADADALENLSLKYGFYEIPFLVSVPKGTVLTVGGKEVGVTPVETSDVATLTLGTDSVYIPSPVVRDSKEKHSQITVVYAKSHAGFMLTKRIPAEWFAEVTYPVITDASLSVFGDVVDGSVGNYIAQGATWSGTTSAQIGTNMYNTGVETISLSSSMGGDGLGGWYGYNERGFLLSIHRRSLTLQQLHLQN